MPSTARTSPRTVISAVTAAVASRTAAKRFVAACCVLACTVLLATPSPADARPVLRGCSGQATSIAPDGTPLSTLVVPAPEESNPDLVTGTVNDPFRVAAGGTVQYAGNTDVALRDSSWRLAVFGIPVRNGSDPNDDGDTVLSGQSKVEDEIPFGLTGLYRVSGSVRSADGRCSGDFWVRVLGDPTGSLPWLCAFGLIVLGGIVLITARPTLRPEQGLGLDEEAFT